MKRIVVLSLIVAFMVTAFFLNRWMQQLLKPKKSLGRLFLYFLIVLLSVFVLSFLMVLLIAKLFPDELIK